MFESKQSYENQSAADSVVFTSCVIVQSLIEAIAYIMNQTTKLLPRKLLYQFTSTPCCKIHYFMVRVESC